MVTLYVMCGIIGAGKTTIAKGIEENCKVKRHSYDEYSNAIGNRMNHKGIKEIFLNRIVSDLKHGHDVVCDDGNILLEDRKYILDKLSDVECKKVLISINTSVEECVKRNAQRQGEERVRECQIHLAYQVFQKPSIEEGWDEIYIYENKCI